MVFQASRKLLAGATSNMIAHPGSKRWFNPPSQWTAMDVNVPIFIFLGPPAWALYNVYLRYFTPAFSHYKDKNYYPTLPYTKEFIHEYKRLERWRWY